MRRVHVLVRGAVQGVGYRYTMRIVAHDLGVSGWVRNRFDGSVEAEIEGTTEQVEDLLTWMAAGPPGSRPSTPEVDDIDLEGATSFEVRATV
ncbi:acylphosphatase [Microbacterium sp. ASV49]|uniref:acylphosphatase n=1 Tax=Microbacterium candidum TaxID=3041922 RepID=A0ABT7N3R0_9MICO|nr:acylphosphatase [Microbacterium sp. ASV49]MDL9981342.1 acylphosphatase [Microbacterium sp. ASV49]